MLVKIKLNTYNTRKRDKFLKRGLDGVITLSPFHNHSLTPAETMNFLPAEECKIKEEDSFNDDLGNISFNGKSSFNSQLLHNTTNQSSENSIQADDRCRKSGRLLGKLKFGDSFKDDLGKISLNRTSSCSSESHLITSNHSPENSIPSDNKCQKNQLNESLLNKIKCEDSVNDDLGNAFDSTSNYNPESLLITENHSSEDNLQADCKCRKKELSERLLDLLGNGLEKFDASETVLEMAVKQLEQISSEEDWEIMLATLGSSVSSKKEREAAIMSQYIPIAPKPIGVTKSYIPVTKGNKRYACSIPSIESEDIRVTKVSRQFTYR